MASTLVTPIWLSRFRTRPEPKSISSARFPSLSTYTLQVSRRTHRFGEICVSLLRGVKCTDDAPGSAALSPGAAEANSDASSPAPALLKKSRRDTPLRLAAFCFFMRPLLYPERPWAPYSAARKTRPASRPNLPSHCGPTAIGGDLSR